MKIKVIPLPTSKSTVKLGYNELGYNELPVITNVSHCLVGSNHTNKTFSWL